MVTVALGDAIGIAVGVTNIIVIAVSSGMGEIVFFFVKSMTPPPIAMTRVKIMMPMATFVFVRSSIYT